MTYWEIAEKPPSGNDPLDALTVRLASAYGDPGLLKFHLDDVGSAAGRAARLCDPEMLVATRGQVLTATDYLSAYVMEATLHHLDLGAHLPQVPKPPREGLAAARTMLEAIACEEFPASLPDEDVLLIGTGRRMATDDETEVLGKLATALPFVLS